MPKSVSVVSIARLTALYRPYGSKQVDPAYFLIPLVGFLPATDPSAFQGDASSDEQKLLIDREFVLRYETENSGDGLPAGEGAFWRAAFGWSTTTYYTGATRKLGQYRTVARARNDVGLFAEEFDPLSGRMLGNFPQAYSHVGLINCALNLSRQTGPVEERAEPQALAITTPAWQG